MAHLRRETYQIAHTARCKLQMAADQPDRNLRFILGHAFTLDKLRLRIAEIEVAGAGSDSDSDSDSDDEDALLEMAPRKDRGPVCGAAGASRRVAFQETKGASPAGATTRRGSPPLPQLPLQVEGKGNGEGGGDSSEEEGEGHEDIAEDEEGEDLGLVRFGSASAQPPRVVAADEEEPEPEAIEVGERTFSRGELKLLCEGAGDEELREAYASLAGCPCHGEKGPQVERLWEVPGPEGAWGPRLAVVQVA